jgi:hypothetical protein
MEKKLEGLLYGARNKGIGVKYSEECIETKIPLNVAVFNKCNTFCYLQFWP